MNRLAITLIILFSLTYPFAIYYGIQHSGPAVFSIFFLAASAFKFMSARDKTDRLQIAALILGVIYSLSIAITDSDYLLRLYPVFVSSMMAFLFASSLFQKENLIETLSKKMGAVITDNAKRYTRKLSLIWCCLLLANAVVAAYLALFASLKTWALYCGFICYCIFACTIIIELIYRRYYISRYGP